MFKITNEWLDAHRTKNGGWTKAQAESLWVKWPFQKGWKKQFIGQYIRPKNKEAFEGAVNITCKIKKTDDLSIDKCIKYLYENVSSFNGKQIIEIKKLGIDAGMVPLYRKDDL